MADQNWCDVTVVREHITAAANDIARFEAANFEDFIRNQLTVNEEMPERWRIRLESPLEAIFYVWWQAMVGMKGYWGNKFHADTQETIDVSGVTYRLDFVISLEVDDRQRFEAKGFRWPLIAVELDGHAFHEKTREQVAYRNTRDRLLQHAGWVVLHYSWTEMTTQPWLCIGEVLGVARERYESIHRQVMAADRAALVE